MSAKGILVIIPAQGVLFDCDGVLVDSLEAAAVAWDAWAERFVPGYDFRTQVQHGVRAADTVATLVSPERVVEAVAALDAQEIETASETAAIAGSVALTTSLPSGRWAVVTSAIAELARRRLAAAGHPVPSVMIAAEDVEHGKPAPDPYLRGAARLGLDPAHCVVFEDAAAGVRAARAAGAGWVVGVGDHLDGEPVDVAVDDLRSVRFVDGALVIEAATV